MTSRSQNILNYALQPCIRAENYYYSTYLPWTLCCPFIILFAISFVKSLLCSLFSSRELIKIKIYLNHTSLHKYFFYNKDIQRFYVLVQRCYAFRIIIHYCRNVDARLENNNVIKPAIINSSQSESGKASTFKTLLFWWNSFLNRQLLIDNFKLLTKLFLTRLREVKGSGIVWKAPRRNERCGKWYDIHRKLSAIRCYTWFFSLAENQF